MSTIAYRSRIAAVWGVLGVMLITGMTTAVLFKFHGRGSSLELAGITGVASLALLHLALECRIAVRSNMIVVYYLFCYRRIPLSHIDCIELKNGDLVIKTGIGQAVRPWPYLASMAGVFTGHKLKRQIRDSLAASVKAVTSAQCRERHALQWYVSMRILILVVMLYSGLIGAALFS